MKGRDLKDLEVNLSAETFARLFTKTIAIQPASGFKEILARVSPAERAIVERFVEVKPSTPKVNIPR